MTRTLPPEVRGAVPGPRSRALSARLSAVECPAFDARREARAAASGEDQAGIVYARGEGSNVWDVDGNRYVDLVAGFGALVLGHAPTAVVAAASAELARLPLALGDVYGSAIKVEALEAIAALHPEPGARVLLGTSGADAVTAALKTAALATGRAGVVAFEGSYHGLAHGPLAACGLAPSFREPFAGQTGDFVRFAPYPRAAAPTTLDEALTRVRAHLGAGGVGAVLVEPLLGRGGCVAPPAGFLAELARLAREHDALLVADEIWTGLGRAGAWLASAAECVPDVVCLGKGLGAGYPVSACVGRADVMASWGAHGGSTIHTATHFGTPPACAAAVAALRELRTLDAPARARATGEAFARALRAACPSAEVTGAGLMIGVHVAGAGRALAVARRLLAAGFVTLTGGPGGGALTLSPALTLEIDVAEDAARALGRALA